nr:Flp family type IVb pilin [uncultured Rhodopila sp.]
MFTYLVCLLQNLKTNRKGVTALEYGVIAAAIIGAIATILGTVGTNIKATFSTLAAQI